MKFKYFFALILVLSTLFLLGTVMASENIDYNANSTSLSIDSVDEEYLTSPDAIKSISDNSVSDNRINSSSEDEIDLTVDMELGDVKKTTYGINQMSFDVPLIIHTTAINGTAKNTKIYLSIPDDFEFISSSQSTGTYDSKSKIWDIGDLQSGTDATLTILTKINTKGKFTIYVNATTDSNDVDLSNNDLKCDIEVTSKISSNTTRTSAQQNEAQHNTHYASIAQGANRQINWENLPQPNPNTPDAGNGDSQNNEQNEEKTHEENNNNQNTDTNNEETGNDQGSDDGDTTDSGSEDENEDTTKSVSKEANTNIISSTINTINDAINSILNPDSKSNDGNPFNSKIVKAIAANDYRTIAILIFGLFLVILICNLGYEKIKS